MNATEAVLAASPRRSTTWAKVIDQTRCIGCHACTTACKSENQVPLSVTRTYVKYVDIGVFPQTRRVYQVTRCNQCDSAPCVAACPTAAIFKRPDGIVDFDKSVCIGCKACIAACPYDAIFINPEDHSAEKCNFCAHRIDLGLEPACVVVCPADALIVGDLADPQSKVARMVRGEAIDVRRPEMGTRPLVFYKGAHTATLEAGGRTIAVVGMSAKSDRPSNQVAHYLQTHGYRIIPVNPTYAGTHIYGERCYPSLSSAAATLAEQGVLIDLVDCFRKSDAISAIADEAIAIVQSWGAAFATFELEIRHVASTDDSVLVERVDIFRRDDGSTFLALPVVGVAEFRDGKITEWREYYDTAAVPGLGN